MNALGWPRRGVHYRPFWSKRSSGLAWFARASSEFLSVLRLFFEVILKDAIRVVMGYWHLLTFVKNVSNKRNNCFCLHVTGSTGHAWVPGSTRPSRSQRLWGKDGRCSMCIVSFVHVVFLTTLFVSPALFFRVLQVLLVPLGQRWVHLSERHILSLCVFIKTSQQVLGVLTMQSWSTLSNRETWD